MDQLISKKRTELLELAKTYNIKGRYKMKKDELIAALIPVMIRGDSSSSKSKSSTSSKSSSKCLEGYIISLLNDQEDANKLKKILKTYKKDIEMWVSNYMEITPGFETSIKEWPKTKSEIILTRGQFNIKTLNSLDRKPFFSTSIEFVTANKFAYGEDCCMFMIRVQPGIPYLPINNQNEYEVLLASGGVFSKPIKKPLEYMTLFTQFQCDWEFFEGEDKPDFYEVIYSPKH